MGTVVAIVVIVFVVLFIISKAGNSINKSAQKMKNHNRCEDCKSRLKAVNGKYAPTCRKCSHRQSWAAKV